MILKESNQIKAKMTFEGNNSYIVGDFKDDYMEGKCKLLIDGKFEVESEFRNKKLLINDPS